MPRIIMSSDAPGRPGRRVEVACGVDNMMYGG